MTDNSRIIDPRFVRLGSTVVVVFAAYLLIAASSSAAPQVQRDGLRPIPHPDLTKLEASVAEQIRTLRETFQQLATTDGIADRNLGEAHGDLGRLYHAYELVDAADACYENATLLAPSDYRWHHLLGHLRESTGRLDAGAESYRQATHLAPNSEATWVHLGNVYLQLNSPAEAAEAFEAALEVDPNEAAAHNGLGELKLNQRKYVEAVGHLRRALELAPAATRIHYLLGMAYRGQGDLEKARGHLQQRGTVGVKPRDPLTGELQDLLKGERVHILQGRLAFNADRFQQAADSFAEALKADPKSARARVNLGTALGRIGDTEGAMREFNAAVEVDPENVTARFNLGTLLVRSGRHAEAVDHLAFVVRERPQDVEAKRELAKSFIHLGRNEEALVLLPAVVEANLGDEEPLFALVNLWIDRRRHKEARDVLALAHERFPSNGRTAHALARLLATSPDTTLRDGAKAVDIAARVYASTKQVAHGETLAMALAERGSCAKAATLQETLLGAATKIGESEIVARLTDGLRRYRAGTPCNLPVAEP